MTNPLYTRLEALAQRMIADFGKPAVLTRKTMTGPPHNPTTTSADYPVQLVDIGYHITNRDSTLIQAGDKAGIISTAGEAPTMSDTISIDGTVYSFVDIQPLNVGGLTLIYEYVARK